MTAPSLAELNQLVNRSTFHRRRAEAMGWRFRDLRVVTSFSLHGYVMAGAFTCVCGRDEAFSFAVDEAMLFAAHDSMRAAADLFDPAARLRRHGSFSRVHLLADGYSEEQVAEFERLGREFDEANR